tara:strand:+ start:64 stop:252 length:189 start_codon:yes stop_codon:yes gene_type:complete
MKQLKYTTKIIRGLEPLAFVEIPIEILEELGWQIGDDIVIEETEVCEDEGETKGLVISKIIL